MFKFLKILLCEHNYELIEDKFNAQGKRQVRLLGYYTKLSKCRVCGYTLEHD